MSASTAAILEATKKALSAPLTRVIPPQQVDLGNGKHATIAATFDPRKTTASAITSFALKLLPNASGEITKFAVAAAMKLVNDVPVFRSAGDTAVKIHENQLLDAEKAVGFALSGLPASKDISQASGAIATSALASLGASAPNPDIASLVQYMVENSLYTFQYAPTSLRFGVSNFAQNSAPGKSGFVDANLNEVAAAVLSGIIKGTVGFSTASVSNPAAPAGLEMTARSQQITQALASGYVNAYISACRVSNASPMPAAALVAAGTSALAGAFQASGVAGSMDSLVAQAFQQAVTQNQQYTAVKEQTKALSNGAINGAGNPNLSGVGQNAGIPAPVTDTVGH